MAPENKAPAFLRRASLQPGGYMLIDNRNSGGPTMEMDTFTCCHCRAIVVMHPQRERPRNKCRKCDATTCDQPACVLECDHWEKKLDQGRPWLQPHQVPAEKALDWFPKVTRDRTPLLWLPRSVGGIYGPKGD